MLHLDHGIVHSCYFYYSGDLKDSAGIITCTVYLL